MSKEEDWKREIKALLKPIEDSLGNVSSDLKSLQQLHLSQSEGEEDKLPLLKCKGKDCGYQTASVEDYVEHRIDEILKESKPAPTEPTEPPKRRHETVEDYLNCPECFPKFEKAFLSRGYVKAPEPEKKEEKKKKGLL